MLAVLEVTLDPFPADDSQLAVFDKSMDCICALLNFYLMAQYKSHTFPTDTAFNNGYRALWDGQQDRKSTRLNSSHVKISYAVFCLKKKKMYKETHTHY